MTALLADIAAITAAVATFAGAVLALAPLFTTTEPTDTDETK